MTERNEPTSIRGAILRWVLIDAPITVKMVATPDLVDKLEARINMYLAGRAVGEAPQPARLENKER